MRYQPKPGAVYSLVCHSASRLILRWFVILCVLTPGSARSAHAQLSIDSVEARIDRAFLTSNVQELRQVRAQLERALAVKADPWLQHYYGFALFRESLLVDDEQLGRSAYLNLLSTAEQALRKSAERIQIAENPALLARVLGRILSLEPRRGAELGPVQGDLRATAERLGLSNPRIWLLRGVGAIYTPPQYGGGLDRAEEWLRKAVELFEQDAPAAPAPRWGRAEAHAWLGHVYAETQRTALAAEQHRIALRLAPEYAWVKAKVHP